MKRGGAYTFGGGKGSRTGSGLSLAKTLSGVLMGGENREWSALDDKRR
jgi:hypothetical protein